MKSLRSLLFFTLLLLPALAAATEPQRLPVRARIVAVTVYPDRALTSRSATLTLQPGAYLVTFDGLPTLLQDDSFRVSGKGSAAALIVGLEVKRAFLAESGEKQGGELDREIRSLEERFALLDAQGAGLTSQREFLESIKVGWGERLAQGLAVGRPSLAELQDAAGFVGSGVSKVLEASLKIENEKLVLQNQIDALRRQRQETIASGRKESKSVEILVEISRAGELTLTLDGVISRASWVPAYDVRLAADAKSAEMTFRALIRQQTGEEWSNVDLTLSTARPASGGAPPQLYPWRLSLLRPTPVMARAMLYGAPPPRPTAMAFPREEGEMAVALKTDAAEEPALIEIAEVSAEESSLTFHLPRRIDLPADNSQHASVVASTILPVAMEFLAIPKLSPQLFLQAELVNSAPYPLLPGKVSTFTGNTFTGSAPLAKVAAGEKFNLYFGSDDQVTIKREEIKQHKDAGIFGSNRGSYRYRIELNNYRQEAVTVTVRDQLPLAADEEIKVSLVDPSLKPEEIASDGRITWKTLLSPGSKKELTFGIAVEYPKEREIIGL